MTAVTCLLPSKDLRKNWPQVTASKSSAHSGKLLPLTARNNDVLPNGGQHRGSRVRCRWNDALLCGAVVHRIIDLDKIRLLPSDDRFHRAVVLTERAGNPDIAATAGGFPLSKLR